MGRLSIIERFEKYYLPEPNSGCWLWVGAINPYDYGIFYTDRLEGAHRSAYRLFKGPIPEGLVIDHLCRTRSCVNPAHLEAVTLAENLRRGENTYRNRTHCRYGHPYLGDNLVLRKTGLRECRICIKRYNKTARDKRRTYQACMGQRPSQAQQRPRIPEKK